MVKFDVKFWHLLDLVVHVSDTFLELVFVVNFVNACNRRRVANQEAQDDHREEVHEKGFESTFVTTEFRDDVKCVYERVDSHLFAIIDVQKDVYITILFVIIVI